MKLAAGLFMMAQADLNVVPAEFHTEQSKFLFKTIFVTTYTAIP